MSAYNYGGDWGKHFLPFTFPSSPHREMQRTKNMWLGKGNGGGKKTAGNGLVAVAVDKDKSSQIALRWTIENLLSRGHPVILIHVVSTKSSSYSGDSDQSNSQQFDKSIKELFLTFRVLCTCKSIPCLDITLEETDIAKALVDYVNYAAIESLVLGASKGGFMRKFKHSDIPTVVSRGVPDFCTVYVISKGKISSVRNSSRAVAHSSPLQKQLESLVKEKSSVAEALPKHSPSIKSDRVSIDRSSVFNNIPLDKDPNRMRRINEKLFSDFSDCSTDLSFCSSDRPSVDLMYSPHYDIMEPSRTPPRMSNGSEHSFTSARMGNRCSEFSSMHDFSYISQDSGRTSCSSQMTVAHEEAEAEMRRMKLELKQTMDLYSTACKEALTAKQKAMELERWRMQEEKKSAIEDKSKVGEITGEAAKRIAQQESESRLTIERRRFLEDEGLVSANSVCRYRTYSIEEIESATDNFDPSRKIGEGGYGPVFKCNLDHTSVAVKILRPDAAQGRMQFNQEVEVLSCIRHPNLVLLLGACPEYGVLVYECMARGSLDDRLFRRGNTPPLTWQIRFRIAAEIATGLHFLHQTKPEPLVHRDLKPANILLDQNYVSKISDVGLARLVPPTVADSVTQYRLTSTAGTFCYIDPEYQQTGMLGVKSDVYSFGVLLLQLITAKPPMAIAHHVTKAIEKGREAFLEILDPAVPDWPFDETLSLVKLAAKCAEMRKKDRPDLGKVVLPELARLRDFADDSMTQMMFYSGVSTPSSMTSTQQKEMSDPRMNHSDPETVISMDLKLNTN
ncbi:hypothetical protein V2J09_002993 [Rumex salicifolius]